MSYSETPMLERMARIKEYRRQQEILQAEENRIYNNPTDEEVAEMARQQKQAREAARRRSQRSRSRR